MKYTLETFPGPGIYFGLDENLYHSLPYCGSSNIKKLYSSPPDYWFESHMNPLREVEDESFALKLGTALHHRILYGEEDFKAHYRPLSGGNKDGTIGADELRAWLKEQGASPAKLKADNERMAYEQFGVMLMAEKAYERVIVSAHMIVKNPNLAQAFINGWPEVSIFWIDDGVPCKCRIDYLKLNAWVDLKSFSGKQRIMRIDEMVLKDLFNYRYDIQAAHYMGCHEHAVKFVAESKVFYADGCKGPPATWLEKAFSKPPQWVFVFYKNEGAPISKSYQVPNGSPAHETGKYAVKLALDNYRDNMEKFGTDCWVNLDEPFQIVAEDMPKWL